MKTTLVIPDQLVRLLKQEAARRGTTMSALVAAALKTYLDASPEGVPELVPLPVYRMGRPVLDVSNRDELHDLMDDRR